MVGLVSHVPGQDDLTEVLPKPSKLSSDTLCNTTLLQLFPGGNLLHTNDLLIANKSWQSSLKKEASFLKFTSRSFLKISLTKKRGGGQNALYTEDVQNLSSSSSFWLQIYICVHEYLISLRYLQINLLPNDLSPFRAFSPPKPKTGCYFLYPLLYLT